MSAIFLNHIRNIPTRFPYTLLKLIKEFYTMCLKIRYFLMIMFAVVVSLEASPPDLVRKLFKVMSNEVDTQQIQWDSTAKVESSGRKELLVNDGNVYLNRDLYGNITLRNGNLIISDSSRIFGNVYLTDDSALTFTPLNVSRSFVQGKVEIKRKTTCDAGQSIDGDLVYNRVQGLYFEINFNKNKKKQVAYFRPTLAVGYGFSNKKVDFTAGLERSIKSFLHLGILGFSRVASPDYWLFSKDENTITALFIKEDYFDYYRETGLSLSSTVNLSRGWGRLSFNHIDYDSQEKNTSYSFFSKNKKLRENPALPEEDLNIQSLSWVIHYTQLANFSFGLEMEQVLSSSLDNLDYHILSLNHTGTIPLGLWDEINYRLKVSSAGDELPWFKQMALGGFNTLRGYDFKEFCGNRMMLLNLEYKIDYSSHDQGFFNPFRIPIYLFQDFGLVWNQTNPDNILTGWDKTTWNQIKYNFGIGFGLDDEFRFNIAKRCDTSHDPWVFTIRLNRAF